MSVQLKVFVTAQDKTVVMRFNMDMGVSEVLKQIKEKTGEGGADHGLYLKKIRYCRSCKMVKNR